MHFLPKDTFSQAMGKRWAMVHVKLTGKKALTLPEAVTIDGRTVDNFFLAKSDTLWAKVPDDVHVYDHDGKRLEPSKGRAFYVTVETFNPRHGLTEASPHDF